MAVPRSATGGEEADDRCGRFAGGAASPGLVNCDIGQQRYRKNDVGYQISVASQRFSEENELNGLEIRVGIAWWWRK